MSETTLEKQILHKLDLMEKNMKYIIHYIEDSKLDEDDKKALAEALQEEKEGKLLSKEQTFS